MNLKRWHKRKIIKVMVDKELKLLLKKNDITFIDDNLLCASCRKKLIFDDIGAVIIKGEKIIIVCDSNDCIKAMITEDK